MPFAGKSLFGMFGLVAAFAASTVAQAYDLASGPEDGKLQRLSAAIASVVGDDSVLANDRSLASLPTNGFVENARLLRDDRAEFALIDSLTAYWIGEAKGPFAGDEPFDDLKVVAVLWYDVDHFVIGKAALQSGTIADFEDLPGAHVSLSDENATQINSNQQILNQFGGIFDARIDLDLLTGPSSVQRLDYDQIGGLALTAPIPSTVVSDAVGALAGGGVLVGLTSGQFANLRGSRQGAWSAYRIPAGTYPGQDAEIDTTARPIMLVTRTDVGDEDVYQITSALFRNLSSLARRSALAKHISLENAASEDLLFPLHPGAARYYQEVGLVTGNDVLARLETSQDPLAQRDSTIDPWKAYRPLQSIVFSGTPENERSRTFISFFAFNSTDLDESAEATLQEIVDFGQGLGEAEIFVAGHTDRAGSSEVNERVARTRAESVVRRLVELGYDERLITSAGFGEDLPAVSTADDEQHQQNRRVETVVTLPAAATRQVVSLSGTSASDAIAKTESVEDEVDVAAIDRKERPALLIDSASGNEADQDVTLDLRLSAPSDLPVVLIVTQVNGTATAGQDFESSPSVITLRPGETEARWTTALIDDDLAEDAESFEVQISGSRDHVDIPDEPIVITIEDND